MKKGFTLIELLAVILILGVIALIAVPRINNIVEDAKISGALASTDNFVKAADSTFALEMLNNKTSFNGTYETGTDDNEIAKIKVQGKTPSYVYIEYENGAVTEGHFCMNGYSFIYDGTETKKSESDYCSVKKVAGLYDEYNELIVSMDDLINTYHMNLNWRATAATNGYYQYYDASTIALEGLGNTISQEGWYHVTADSNGNDVHTKVNYADINSYQPNVVIAKFPNAKKLIVKDLESIPFEAFLDVRNIDELIIGGNIGDIDQAAFDETGFKTIKITGDIEMSNYMFIYSYNLENVYISGKVKTISKYAFQKSSKLSSLTLEEGVRTLEAYAFAECSSLTNITIPASVKTIKGSFFKTGLKTATFVDKNAAWEMGPGSYGCASNVSAEECHAEYFTDISVSDPTLNATRLLGDGSNVDYFYKKGN